MTTSDTTPLADRRKLLTEKLRGDGRVKVAPVSFGQRRLWLVDRLSPGGLDYNVVWPLRLVGELDAEALRLALTQVVARHEVLRSRFAAVDGEPVAVIDPPSEPEMPLRDLSGLAAQAAQAELERAVSVQTTQPFDLAAGPLVRLSLVRLNATEHVLLFAAHHIVFDGWSSSILLDELSALYRAAVADAPDPLEAPALQYSDYAVWEREWLAGPVLAEQIDHWRTALAGAPDTMELPSDLPRPARRTGRGARLRLEYPPDVAKALGAVCAEEGATPFMGLLAAYSVLLSRYTGSSDVLVGTFAANRTQPELERLIGFFVNTLVLRTDTSGDPSFRELLRRCRTTALSAFANQDVPFDRVVEELQPRRTPGVTPWLQAALVVQNTPEETGHLGDLLAESLTVDTPTATFDLSLHLWHNADGGLTGFFEYATDLFTPDTVTRLAGHVEALLRRLTADPDRPVNAHPLLTPAERLTLCRPQERVEPRERTLHELVTEQAERRPDAVAAVCGDRSLTYRELDRRANHLAYRLQRVGVRAESVVGICVERSPESLVAMLGVLKAGGAYLPLDPENPPDRIDYMLAHSGAGVVVAQPHLIQRCLPHGLPNVLRLDDSAPPPTGYERAPASRVTPDNLAYVIYTSGSTGRPKGVGVSHRAAVGRVHRPSYLDIGEDDVMLHALALSFDVSVLEVFAALTNGARLAVLPGKALPERVCDFLVRQRVTVGWLTAALFHAVIETDARAVAGMRTLIAGGDQLSSSHTERALGRLTGRLVNGYGPTEATIFATTHPMDPARGLDAADRVPIGRAIPDTSVLVLDRHLNPVPVGVPGELFLGGGCLARGYLHRADLTAERFVPHPDAPGERMYRTGDVVRWRADGTLVFLGRVDHQVKIRGFRVELGEIEQLLRRHPAVREAVVVTRPTGRGGDGEDTAVVAYVECTPQDRPGTSELLAHCRAALPDYMVPAVFMVLDALPLNPNGKVDRGALPAPEGLRPDLAADYVAPRNPIEETLATIWAQLLELDRVGVHDGFFDVGGHSLLASRL
ncbi:MAG TPA: amino acid adenylation domain-containing protein, partial [Pseudonocardiaceae bacterium]